MPHKDDEAFVCRGCGQPIDKSDVTQGHKDRCPYWGLIRYAHVDRSSLHELLRIGEAEREKYPTLRDAAYGLANAILSTTKPSANQQCALRMVREAMVTAISGVVAPTKVQPPAGQKERGTEPCERPEAGG